VNILILEYVYIYKIVYIYQKSMSKYLFEYIIFYINSNEHMHNFKEYQHIFFLEIILYVNKHIFACIYHV
jgi:hypothetical protein